MKDAKHAHLTAEAAAEPAEARGVEERDHNGDGGDLRRGEDER